MRTVWVHTAIILTLSTLLFLFQDNSNQWLAYYHNGIAKGQVWRLLTAHFCHTNGYHLLLNGTGLMVVAALFLDTFKHYSMLAMMLTIGLLISLCLYWIEPHLQWYVGLSGVLHGLFAFGVCDELKKRDKWGVILGLGFIIKVAYEQINGPSATTEALIGATVLINAHLYGAIAGVIYFSLMQVYSKAAIK
ncbi:rhombosortase [Psychromonas sp.]|uniref:rhombosortase n=1 Tax=Psychromonas sp. TaxID=1884585 RepID=UPI003A979A16